VRDRVANLFSPKKPDLVPKKAIAVKAYTHKTCITKHKIDIKTSQKHRYNVIPLFGNILFPRNYAVVHLFLINKIDHFLGNGKFFFILCTLQGSRLFSEEICNEYAA